MDADTTPLFNVAVTPPMLTPSKWGEAVGLTEKTVRCMLARGLLPPVYVGKRIFVNVEALRRECAAREFTL